MSRDPVSEFQKSFNQKLRTNLEFIRFIEKINIHVIQVLMVFATLTLWMGHISVEEKSVSLSQSQVFLFYNQQIDALKFSK